MELFREDGCLSDEGLHAPPPGSWTSWDGWKPPSISPTATNAPTVTPHF